MQTLTFFCDRLSAPLSDVLCTFGVSGNQYSSNTFFIMHLHTLSAHFFLFLFFLNQVLLSIGLPSCRLSLSSLINIFAPSDVLCIFGVSFYLYSSNTSFIALYLLCFRYFYLHLQYSKDIINEQSRQEKFFIL